MGLYGMGSLFGFYHSKCFFRFIHVDVCIGSLFFFCCSELFYCMSIP